MTQEPKGQTMAEKQPHSDRSGKIGWILLWLLGVPLPILLILFVLRGCT